MPFGGWNRALDEVNIPPLERAILGVIRPIEKHWESLEYLQELIRRWDSERELFNDDIAHTQAYFKIPKKRQTYFV